MNDKAKESLTRVIAQFQQGGLSPLADVARIRLADDAPAARWSYCNRVLAYMQTRDLDCRGYRQWEAVGRQVKRGQHCGYIFVPRCVKEEDENGKETSRCVGFLTAAVFGYSQTDGDGNSMSYTPAALPPLADLAARLGINVTWEPLASSLGDCTPDGSRIRVGADGVTFFHELAHACHARLNGKLKPGQHIDQETVAEVTACVLATMYGQGDYTGNAWQYIRQYSGDPLHAIGLVLDQVEQVLNFICEKEAGQ